MATKSGGKGKAAARKPSTARKPASSPNSKAVASNSKARPIVGEVLPPEGAPAAKGRARNPTGKSAPDHVPNDASKRLVEAMASYGIPHPDIAALVGETGISEPTLRKHYRRELDTARAKLSAKLTESLVAQALGHPAVYDDQGRKVRDEQKRYAPAAMWLLRREDFIEEKRLAEEARAQEAARQAMRDRLKIAFEFASPDEIEVIERVFGRVAERLAEAQGRA